MRDASREHRFQALRHAYASWLLANSGHPLAGGLSHADPGFTLRVYTHLMPSGEKKTRKAIDLSLGAAVDGLPTSGTLGSDVPVLMAASSGAEVVALYRPRPGRLLCIHSHHCGLVLRLVCTGVVPVDLASGGFVSVSLSRPRPSVRTW